MKILLVYTNRNSQIAPPPVGLTYIAHPLKQKNHDVKLLDLMYRKNPFKLLQQNIDRFKPEIVGFSIRNLDNQNMEKSDNPLPEIKDYIAYVKQRGILTVVGGSAFTTLPNECMNYLKPDYGIVGQGEDSFTQFVDGFKKGSINKKIPGLVWENEQNVLINPPKIVGYKESISDVQTWNLKHYRKSFAPAAVITKSGCPYSCAYCSPKTTWGNKFIFREVDEIIDDIKRLKKDHNAREFFIIDACFNSPLDYSKQILEAIIRENLKIYINTALVPIKNQFDEELFRLHRKAGGIFTMIGAESFSRDMLKSLRKPFALEDVMKCCKLAEKNNVLYGIQSLFGGPGETHETIDEALSYIPYINFSLYLYTIGIRILPNTHIYDMALKEGIISEYTNLLFPKYYVSQQIDVDWAKNRVEEKLKKYKHRMMKMFNLSWRSFLARFNIIYN